MTNPTKFLITILLFFAVIPNIRADNIKMLIMLSQYYGANYYFIHDQAEKYGWDITLTAVAPAVGSCTSYAIFYGCPTITVDYTVSEITDITEYDILVISSASNYVPVSPHTDILNSPEALALIASAVEEGLIVAGICTGPRVLAAADVINGVNITGHTNFQSEYIAAGANYLGSGIMPVIDGNIVTCTRGMYYQVQNVEAIATAMENLQTTDKGGER